MPKFSLRPQVRIRTSGDIKTVVESAIGAPSGTSRESQSGREPRRGPLALPAAYGARPPGSQLSREPRRPPASSPGSQASREPRRLQATSPESQIEREPRRPSATSPRSQIERKRVASATSATREVDKYSPWRLEGVTPVSSHSAIFHFSSDDPARGTPHPRSDGQKVEPKTWHTTLLAEVGDNEEGPHPWVKRDYTPISSARDWERGRCDILIKIYADGLATSWLHKQPTGCKVMLSQPVTEISWRPPF